MRHLELGHKRFLWYWRKTSHGLNALQVTLEGPVLLHFLTRTLTIGLALSVIALANNPEEVRAGTPSCRSIPDPRFPGLQQCVVSVDAQHVTLTSGQRLSLWCWAASLAMIFTSEGHPITQDEVVTQNFGAPENVSSGTMIATIGRLNRGYTESDGTSTFQSHATPMRTAADAEAALANDELILFTSTQHAMVQLSMTYQVAPGGPIVFKSGTLWDPAPRSLGGGIRRIGRNELGPNYAAAWAITTD